MAQIIKLKLDVSKMDKTAFFRGKNGSIYCDCTFFYDPENPGQYGDHGMVTQDVGKERREAGEKGPILGNGKMIKDLPSRNKPQAQAQPAGDSYAMWQEYQRKQADQGQAPAARVLSKEDAHDDIPF